DRPGGGAAAVPRGAVGENAPTRPRSGTRGRSGALARWRRPRLRRPHRLRDRRLPARDLDALAVGVAGEQGVHGRAGDVAGLDLAPALQIRRGVDPPAAVSLRDDLAGADDAPGERALHQAAVAPDRAVESLLAGRLALEPGRVEEAEQDDPPDARLRGVGLRNVRPPGARQALLRPVDHVHHGVLVEEADLAALLRPRQPVRD